MECIVFENDESVSVISPAPGISIQSQTKLVPDGKKYLLLDSKDLPKDRLFRSAWKINNQGVEVDVVKAKETVHDMRRDKREEEFKPLDKSMVIHILDTAKSTPIELERKKVRDKYADIQTDIDNCADEAELRALINKLNW